MVDVVLDSPRPREARKEKRDQSRHEGGSVMTRYTEIEITQFNRYTNLLRDLVVKEQGEFDGICLNSAKCTACARDAPAGIPRQLRDSDRLLCPACVRHKGLVEALTRELHGKDGSKPIDRGSDTATLTREVQAAMASERAKRAAANPPKTVGQRLTRLARGIHNLDDSLKAESSRLSADEIEARRRIIAAATAGYRRLSGGLDPPREARKPDEVLP